MQEPDFLSQPPPSTDLFSLEHRVALLTSATRHLGQAMARGLVAAGARVVLFGRNPDKMKQLLESLGAHRSQVQAHCFDLADEAERSRQIERIASDYGQLDILINNAYRGKTASVETDTPDDFARAYQVNVSVPFSLIQQTIPLLEKAASTRSGGASVINIASMYATVSPDPSIYEPGQNNPPHYGAAKAGLLQLTRYLACHLAPQGIRVNAISPGPFPAAAAMEKVPSFHAHLCRKNPMGRIGCPDELIGPLLFLASEASSYVTGVNLPVDGGWTAW